MNGPCERTGSVSLRGQPERRFRFAKTHRPGNRYVGGRARTAFIGRQFKDREMHRENSPVKLADSIVAPILLVHGEDDRVVDIAQSKAMAKALARHDKPPKFIILEDGDHHLRLQRNRHLFARELMSFLAEHLAGESQAVREFSPAQDAPQETPTDPHSPQ